MSTETDGEPGEPSTEGAGIQSVEIAATILKALAAKGGILQLREIAAAAAMPRAKVHRYLKSLVRAELVIQEEATGRYRIGPAAITIGLIGLNRTSPVRLAYAMLPDLCDALGETVFVSVWADRGPTVVALEEPVSAVTINIRVGSAVPLLTSAMGRIFAAYLPGQKAAAALKAATAGTAGGTRAVSKILADVRTNGLAAIEGTLLPGINAMAAPVFNHHGQLVMVIGAVGRKESLDTDPNSRKAVLVREAAAGLSGQLGYASAERGPEYGPADPDSKRAPGLRRTPLN